MANINQTRDGAVLRIEIARPEKKNALTGAMYAALAAAIASAEQDEGVRVMLLSGVGGAFTAGNDLQDFLAAPPQADAHPVFHFLTALSHAAKPIVAAVSGPAIGIGTTLLLHCDLVYADETARFALPFVNLGLCPEAGSSLLLPAVAGYQRAAELLLLGEPFGAEKAYECGIVNAVVPAAEVAATALAAAQQLAAKPPAALRATKKLMKRPVLAGLEQAMKEEAAQFARMVASEEAKEAFAAFLEKRKADFSKFG
jgi:enoyl-CoA hydratase/carnithine racemase